MKLAEPPNPNNLAQHSKDEKCFQTASLGKASALGTRGTIQMYVSAPTVWVLASQQLLFVVTHQKLTEIRKNKQQSGGDYSRTGKMATSR